MHVILVITMFSSCDVPAPLLINDKPTWALFSGKDSVIISAKSFKSDDIKMVMTNNINICLDSLKVLKKGNEQKMTNIVLKYECKEGSINNWTESANKKSPKKDSCNNDSASCSAGYKILTITIRRGLNPDSYPMSILNSGKIEIAPCNFLTCNGRPVITDTIRITRSEKKSLLRKRR